MPFVAGPACLTQAYSLGSISLESELVANLEVVEIDVFIATGCVGKVIAGEEM